jgi:hypothetical protein
VFLERAVAKQNAAAAFRFELLRYEVCGAGLIVTQNGEYNLNSRQTLAGLRDHRQRSCAGETSATVPTIQVDLYRFAGSIVLRLHGRHYQMVGVVVVDHRRRDVALAHGR